MTAPRFIICEKSDRWTVSMRWALARGKTALIQTTTLEQCLDQLELAPASLVGLDSQLFGIEGTLRVLRDIPQAFPKSKVLVFVTGPMKVAQPWLYEAGALLVVCSPRNLTAVARFVTRYVETTAEPAATHREAVWDRMPWTKIRRRHT